MKKKSRKKPKRYEEIGKDWCPDCRGWGARINLDNPWAIAPCITCGGTGKKK